MKAKSKIIVSAIALLSLGVAATTAGTVAWYSSQANATASVTGASISTPSDLLAISGWDPYGSTVSLTGGATSISGSAPVNLTDVVSTENAAGGNTTAVSSVANKQGKYFAKYALGEDGDVDKNADAVYNVSMNPTVGQAASDMAVADWGAESDKGVGAVLSLMSVKAGRAYSRFGFALTNTSKSPISITVQQDEFVVTHNTAGDTASAKCLVAKAESNAATIDNIPAGTPVLESASGTSRTVDLGLSVDNIAGNTTVYYVCTIWVDGDLFAGNANYADAAMAVNLKFTAVAA